MLAPALTFVLFGFVLTLVVDVIRRDSRKIMAALEGRSWTAEPSAGRPVTIRFSRLDMGAVLVQLPELRAAA
jgi:hypothetical protein